MTLFELLDNYYTVTHPKGQSTRGEYSLMAEVTSSWTSSLPHEVQLSVTGYKQSDSYASGGIDSVKRPVGRASIDRQTQQIIKITPHAEAQLSDWTKLMEAFKQ